jgi:hypothetical protein
MGLLSTPILGPLVLVPAQVMLATWVVELNDGSHIDHMGLSFFFQSVADPTVVTVSRNLPFPQTAEAACPPLRHA